MTDYGHDLLFGTFVTPSALTAPAAVDLAVAADRAGLDLVTYQDHPYQRRFLDTWTLMSFVAARTERIRISSNVVNLPLRPPAVLAQAAASLDILSGGRFELGIGAGSFWEAIEAMGGRRLSPGESVEALREAITIIREMWDADEPESVKHRGTHYQVVGAKRGPAPAHDISIWVGAYGPKMLELTGALGDGWLPSMQFLPDGADSLSGMNTRIDEAAIEAGRRPEAVRRLLNFGTVGFTTDNQGWLHGPPEQWVEQLAGLTLEHGISAFLIGTDDRATTERFAAEVVPAVRDVVDRERAS